MEHLDDTPKRFVRDVTALQMTKGATRFSTECKGFVLFYFVFYVWGFSVGFFKIVSLYALVLDCVFVWFCVCLTVDGGHRKGSRYARGPMFESRFVITRILYHVK